jgi:hypothetical protein
LRSCQVSQETRNTKELKALQSGSRARVINNIDTNRPKHKAHIRIYVTTSRGMYVFE